MKKVKSEICRISFRDEPDKDSSNDDESDEDVFRRLEQDAHNLMESVNIKLENEGSESWRDQESSTADDKKGSEAHEMLSVNITIDDERIQKTHKEERDGEACVDGELLVSTLMENWGVKLETDEELMLEIDSDSNDHEELTVSPCLLTTGDRAPRTDHVLDHILLACNDLDKAMDLFETTTGTRPVMIFSHNGLGTRSASVMLVSGEKDKNGQGIASCFLEIIGPDHKQRGLHMAPKLASLPDNALIPLHWCIRNAKALELKRKEWPNMGFTCDHISIFASDRVIGLWKWELVFLNYEGGGLLPFFADWSHSHKHPTQSLPVAGHVKHVRLRVSEDYQFCKQMQELFVDGIVGMQCDFVGSGIDNELTVCFEDNNGRKHSFSATNPMGLSFPDSCT